MKRELKESFERRVAGTEDWYSMTVPGSAMDTLVKAGVLPDPYYGENEYQVREFFRNDFDIRGHFTVSPEEFKAGHMLLVFNGIDTVADLYLTNWATQKTCTAALLLTSKNMRKRETTSWKSTLLPR